MRLPTLTSLLLLPLLAGCGSDQPANAAGSGGGGDGADPLAPPLGLESVKLVTPEENPLTAAKAALGKQLFFDPRMSASGKMGCVNCHYPDKAFTDGERFSKKDSGAMNSRNSPTMYNLGYHPMHYWDGRKPGLEPVVLAAWTGQLGAEPEAIASRLNAVAAYADAFEAAFGAPASEQTVVHALASFLRTLRTGNSAFDRFQGGDESALSDAAKKGWELFRGRAGCQACHIPPLFTDAPMQVFHNVGIGMDAESPDLGRGKVTEKPADNGKFKTPTLRDVAHTAPYFHDGSVATLREAVKIMSSGGIDNPNKDPLLVDRRLSDEEIDQLVAFLEALNGDVAWQAPKLPE